MNLRIRELLNQAGAGDNWNKADWYSMSPEMIEKFAELIVQECAGLLDGEWEKEILCGSDAAGILKQHFGVES